MTGVRLTCRICPIFHAEKRPLCCEAFSSQEVFLKFFHCLERRYKACLQP